METGQGLDRGEQVFVGRAAVPSQHLVGVGVVVDAAEAGQAELGQAVLVAKAVEDELTACQRSPCAVPAAAQRQVP